MPGAVVRQVEAWPHNGPGCREYIRLAEGMAYHRLLLQFRDGKQAPLALADALASVEWTRLRFDGWHALEMDGRLLRDYLANIAVPPFIALPVSGWRPRHEASLELGWISGKEPARVSILIEGDTSHDWAIR